MAQDAGDIENMRQVPTHKVYMGPKKIDFGI